MKTMEHYDAELKSIDNKIKAHKAQIDALNAQRRKILVKVKDLDMDVVLECIVEKGLSSNEVLQLINSAEVQRSKQ